MDPANNFALLSAARRTWNFRGREYAVSKLTPRAGGELQRLIMEIYPDPRKAAREAMDGLPDAVAIHVWDRACDEAKAWPPDVDSPQGLRAILSPKGMAVLFHLGLSDGLPGLTREAAEQLAGSASVDEAAELFELMLPEDRRPKTAPPATSPGGQP